jgi:hypothetical protein
MSYEEEEDTCHMRRRIHVLAPTETCKFVNDTGEVVHGHVSNGDFRWLSPRPIENTFY